MKSSEIAQLIPCVGQDGTLEYDQGEMHRSVGGTLVTISLSAENGTLVFREKSGVEYSLPLSGKGSVKRFVPYTASL
jgi:hypothetical protein